MADTHNQAEVKTNYPVVEGLTAGSTKQVNNKFLVTTAEKSFVRKNDKVGF